VFAGAECGFIAICYNNKNCIEYVNCFFFETQDELAAYKNS